MDLKQSRIIGLHLLAWLLFLIIALFFLFAGGPEGNFVFLHPLRFSSFLIYPASFYLVAYFLLPNLVSKRQYLPFVLGFSGMLFLVILLRPYDSMIAHGNNLPPTPGTVAPPGGDPSFVRTGPPVDIISVGFFLLVMSLSVTLFFLKRWSRAVRISAEAQTFRSKAELSSLKAQINPHFLFNTLNNIYSLTLSKDDNAPECIMMLSNIMRYVTDEATQEIVPLQNEADCIKNFIELNRLRLGTKMQFNYSIGGEMENKTIAPLLLITFVENVFKYGISNHETSGINIYLVSEKEKITFFCQNKLFPERDTRSGTGVGIANAKKRLDHLYPGKYDLQITDSDGYYTVRLTLFDN